MKKLTNTKIQFTTFKVRDKEIKIATHTESLSHSQIPKVALPKYQAWGDILKWNLQENVPGESFHSRLDCIHSNVKEKIQVPYVCW